MYLFDYKFSERELVIWGLCKVYGLGRARALKLMSMVGLTWTSRFREMDDDKARFILVTAINKYRLMNDLWKEIRRLIEKEKKTRSYRGMRHVYGLPVWGQRTKTNGSTAKALVKS